MRKRREENLFSEPGLQISEEDELTAVKCTGT